MPFENSSSLQIWNTTCYEAVEEIRNQLEEFKKSRPDTPITREVIEVIDELDKLVRQSMSLNKAIAGVERQYGVTQNPSVRNYLDAFAQFVHVNLYQVLRATKIPRLVYEALQAPQQSTEANLDLDRIMHELKEFNRSYAFIKAEFEKLNIPAFGDSIKILESKLSHWGNQTAQENQYLYGIHSTLASIDNLIKNGNLPIGITKQQIKFFLDFKDEYNGLMNELSKQGKTIEASMHEYLKMPVGHKDKDIHLVKVTEDTIAYVDTCKGAASTCLRKMNYLVMLFFPTSQNNMTTPTINRAPNQTAFQRRAAVSNTLIPHKTISAKNNKRDLPVNEDDDTEQSAPAKKKKRGR